MVVGPVVDLEMGLVPLQALKAVAVTSVTSCMPVVKLNNRLSPTVKFCREAQVE